MNMLTIEINGKKLEAQKGETILTVARRHGIEIPTLCHMEGLAPSGRLPHVRGRRRGHGATCSPPARTRSPTG